MFWYIILTAISILSFYLYIKYRKSSNLYFILGFLSLRLFNFIKRYFTQPHANICKLIAKNQVLLLTYQRGTETHTLRIPHSRFLGAKLAARQINVIACYETIKDEEVISVKKEDITQQAGIPYLITPNLMGASYFLVIDKTGGVLQKIYGNDSVDLSIFD